MATIARKSSAPAAAKGKFDAEVDIITIGSGVAGLATALFSCWQGNEVLVLEKAALLLALGLGLGLAASWFATRAIQAFLFGVFFLIRGGRSRPPQNEMLQP